MSYPGYVFRSPPPVSTRGAEDSEPAPTVPGSPLLKEHILLLLRKRSLLRSSMAYGTGHSKTMDCNGLLTLRRFMSSWDKNACTRSVTRTDPMGDPFQTLERIIDEWSDLELEEHDQSWRLSPVNSACTWSSTNELSSPAYVLTRKGNPFHFLRPHGVLEVVWGHRRPLPFLSGSTTIIVLVSLPRCAGPRSPRLLLAGVTTKSLSSVPLGLSFKCISRLPAVIW